MAHKDLIGLNIPPDAPCVWGVEAGLDHLITEVLNAVQMLQKLNLERGVGVHISWTSEHHDYWLTILSQYVTWKASSVCDARVEVKETPGPGLEAPDQGGEQQHGATVIQLDPDQSEALD